MTIRENLEQWEKDYLSPYASLSVNSKGRLRPEEQCDIRPVFQRDRDRIIHCKAFRRLKDKTQVFLTPEGDHYRTRLTHTLEVSQTARTIAKALKLNEDLVVSYTVSHLVGQIQPLAILLQNVHGADALFGMFEAKRAYSVQRTLSGMSERRVSQIVSQRNGFHQILVQL